MAHGVHANVTDIPANVEDSGGGCINMMLRRFRHLAARSTLQDLLYDEGSIYLPVTRESANSGSHKV